MVFGEVGLTGEVRAVTQVEARLREAAKLGFPPVFTAPGELPASTDIGDIELCGVRTVAEALQVMQQPVPQQPSMYG